MAALDNRLLALVDEIRDAALARIERPPADAGPSGPGTDEEWWLTTRLGAECAEYAVLLYEDLSVERNRAGAVAKAGQALVTMGELLRLGLGGGGS